jgi:hypothetical protein
VFWLDASGAALSSYTTIVGTVSGYVSAWTNNALSGYVTAPAGAAKAIVKIATSAGEPGYWDIDDVLYQPTINQTANGQTGSNIPTSGSGDYSAYRAKSETTIASSYYGLEKLYFTGTSGELLLLGVGGGVPSMAVDDGAGNAINIFVAAGFPIIQITTSGVIHTGVTGETITTSGGVRTIRGGVVCG